jgi:hypothetical protein
MQLETSAIDSIMIPDALTPGQYYDSIRSDDSSVRPIKRLMLAVLEDAMRCYQAYASSRNRAQRRLFLEAEAWFVDRTSDGAFSFETVCETLGIEPTGLRRGLRRWRVQQLDGMNPRRLARRSPVTGVGRISAPLKRRGRMLAQPTALEAELAVLANGKLVNGKSDSKGRVNGNGKANGNGASYSNIARDGLGYDRPAEFDTMGRANAGARMPLRIPIQESAPAPV